MTDLQTRFLPVAEIAPALQNEIDALDRLAFGGEAADTDPVLASIRWAAPDWMGLGFVNERLVAQLCLPKREISVGAETVWVAGVGGVATHPDFQRRGYGLALLNAASTFMRADMRVPFGLLICAHATRPFYERAHWRYAADALCFTQDKQRQVLPTCVMIIELTHQPWPAGEIDLRGAPW